jgi:hypothetical protein
MMPRVSPKLFSAIKYILYALLAFNIWLYVQHGTLNEALDSFGWVLLLIVFEWETRALDQDYLNAWEKAAIWALQLIGYGLAINATRIYFQSAEWADFTNAVLWLLVCATIIYDVFVPGDFGSTEWRFRNAIKVGLYAALVAVAIYWGITGDWLDFYDAMLWILCFFMVELNIFKYEESHDPTPGGASVG